jgi:hypothetical protein
MIDSKGERGSIKKRGKTGTSIFESITSSYATEPRNIYAGNSRLT